MKKIDVDKFRSFLEKNGQSKYFDETYTGDFDPEKMILKYPELKGVPGYKDIFVNSDPIDDIPDNLTEEQLKTYKNMSDLSDSDISRYKDKMSAKNRSEEIEAEKKRSRIDDRRKIVEEYQYPYFGLNKNNPVSKGLNWLADLVISDNTKKAIAEDPDDSVKIAANAAADIGSTAADALPGVGGIVIGPAVRGVQSGLNDNFDAGTIAKDLGVNILTNAGIKGVPGLSEVPGLESITRALGETKPGKIVKKYNDKFNDKWNYKNDKFETPITKESIPGARISDLKDKDIEKITPSYDNMLELRTKYGKNNKMNISGRTDMKDQMIKEGIPKEEVEAAYKKDIDRTTDLAKEAIEDRAKREFEEKARKELYGKNANIPAETRLGRIGDAAITTAVQIPVQGSKAVTKSWLTDKVNPEEEYKPVDTDEDVLDYIIERDSRMWENNFKPHSGIELEAYEKWAKGK